MGAVKSMEVPAWFVRVLFDDGDVVSTRFSVSRSEVETYYAPGKAFNFGRSYDVNKCVDRILEISKA
jgi:hypothetical protein